MCVNKNLIEQTRTIFLIIKIPPKISVEYKIRNINVILQTFNVKNNLRIDQLLMNVLIIMCKHAHDKSALNVFIRMHC